MGIDKPDGIASSQVPGVAAQDVVTGTPDLNGPDAIPVADLRTQIVDEVSSALRAGEASAVAAISTLAQQAMEEVAIATDLEHPQGLADALAIVLAGDPTLQSLLSAPQAGDGDS